MPVERMDIPQMIARCQYWTGWCVDNVGEVPELVRLRFLLQAVTAHLQDERDANRPSRCTCAVSPNTGKRHYDDQCPVHTNGGGDA